MHDNIFTREEIRILARCARVLMRCPDGDKQEAKRFLQLAAEAGDRDSQLHWGLWLARMDASGKRNNMLPGAAKYKEAIIWLNRAGEQGSVQAWYAISQIYLKSEFWRRSLEEAYRYMTMAAEAGDSMAQQALGSWIWRTRKDDPSKDVQAVYWLQKAEAQGCVSAVPLLKKLASRAAPATWALAAQRQLANKAFKVPQVLIARVALAARFGLSIPEALLIDPARADRGHCMEIDIRDSYARGRRRLILIQTPEERQALDDTIRLLDGIDCSTSGPEGNYRKRLYRFKRFVPDWDVLTADDAGGGLRVGLGDALLKHVQSAAVCTNGRQIRPGDW
ncbi:MAG TPA: hypothetical protein VEC35_02320 [Noviherbaspirillum sp.]|nr:hypothetical protein [Noviherbaspirillum sp.]